MLDAGHRRTGGHCKRVHTDTKERHQQEVARDVLPVAAHERHIRCVARRADQPCVPIGLCLDDCVGADHSACAGFVLDRYRHIEGRLDLVHHDPGHDVAHPAGWIRDDDANGSLRESILGASSSGRCGDQASCSAAKDGSDKGGLCSMGLRMSSVVNATPRAEVAHATHDREPAAPCGPLFRCADHPCFFAEYDPGLGGIQRQAQPRIAPIGPLNSLEARDAAEPSERAAAGARARFRPRDIEGV